MKQTQWDILGFGVVAIDDLIYVENYPSSGEKCRVQEIRREGGGLTGTALVAAARQGARVAYSGILGTDELSSFTLKEFEREGVDTSGVILRPQANPYHSHIIIDQSNGQRTIFSSSAGYHRRQPHEIDENLLSSCRLLFIDHTMEKGGLHALRMAKRLGIPTIGDIERVDNPDAHAMLPLLDHLIISITLATQITGRTDPADILPNLSGLGNYTCCAITEGENGCWFQTRDVIKHIPALRVQAVDTTGCGDVFHGVYAAWIAHGYPVEQAIKAATIAAGLKATQPGGRSGIPKRDVIEEMMQTV